MYLAEWGMWFDATADENYRKKRAKDFIKHPAIPLYESDVTPDYTKKKVSDTPRPIGPYYAYNERYLEIRAGAMENYRGVIAWFTVLLCFVIFGGGVQLLFDITMKKSYNHVVVDIFLFLIVVTILLGFIYFLVRYGRYAIRLEVFTHRHLRVRFNRITRQVHIQQPNYCGGNMTFRWQDILPANVAGGNMEGLGIPTILLFHPYKTGFTAPMNVAIGKKTRRNQDYLDEWEFIRRYMEEGPENLPKPRLSSLLPLPWHGIAAHFPTMWEVFLRTPSWFLRLLLTLALTPVLLILSTGYWLSELLCWQPRWSKVIRQAGLPNKPLPPLTQLSDYPAEVQAALLANADQWQVLPDSEKDKPKEIKTKKKSKG